MSHKKGFILNYGVSSDTCSDSSSARSLLKQTKVVSKELTTLKRIPNQLDTVFNQHNMD